MIKLENREFLANVRSLDQCGGDFSTEETIGEQDDNGGCIAVSYAFFTYKEKAINSFLQEDTIKV